MTDNAAVLTAAVALEEPFEGFSACPYQDSVGVWTIGNGSTRDAAGRPVTSNTPDVTREEARQLAMRDLQGALRGVEGDVRVPLSVGQMAALVDFTYNLGIGAFNGSTLLRLLNAGDYAGAANEFGKWDHAGGHVLAGLARRRAAERAVFLGTDAEAPTLALQAPAEAPAPTPAPSAQEAPAGLLSRLASVFGWSV